MVTTDDCQPFNIMLVDTQTLAIAIPSQSISQTLGSQFQQTGAAFSAFAIGANLAVFSNLQRLQGGANVTIYSKNSPNLQKKQCQDVAFYGYLQQKLP